MLTFVCALIVKDKKSENIENFYSELQIANFTYGILLNSKIHSSMKPNKLSVKCYFLKMHYEIY